jgi:hypothetical protein
MVFDGTATVNKSKRFENFPFPRTSLVAMLVPAETPNYKIRLSPFN